jgi:hypothetical protein
MKLTDRLNSLDDRAANRGWIGRARPGQSLADGNPVTMSALWGELNDTPPGWIGLAVVTMIILAMVAPIYAQAAWIVLVAGWVAYATRRIRRRMDSKVETR